MSKKVYVWPRSIRVFHWLLGLSFFFSLVTSYFENLLLYHAAFGMVTLVLGIFRIIWGLVGPLYTNFAGFDFQKRHLVTYFWHLIGYREKTAGHNPASSWAALLILMLVVVIGISGQLLYGVQEGRGLLAFLNPLGYRWTASIDWVHRLSAYVLLAIASTHISGVVFEHLYHKTHIIMGMITGYKRVDDESMQDIHVDRSQNIFAVVFIALTIGTFAFALCFKGNPLVKSRFAPVDYERQNEAYALECSECHLLFPPQILPRASWAALMDGLADHFGEPVDLDASTARSIRNNLTQNSAETSSEEFAYKMLASFSQGGDPLSVIKTPYWQKRHRHLPDSLFDRPAVDGKISCEICHPDIESGMIEDDRIRIPELTWKEALRFGVFVK